MANKPKYDPTVCASCKTGKLAKVSMWGGAAVYWYCIVCGWINRWNRC